MKKRSIALVLAVLTVLFATEIFAGSIDYLSNQSAEYIRTFSRNASTDADAVNYNPAGTAFMGDGLSFYVSNQSIFKDYTNTWKASDKEFKTEEPSLLVPNAYVAYKQGQFAGYLGAGIIGGGGNVVYDDGIPTMVLYSAIAGGAFQSGKLEASSYYYGITLGGAYAINEMISLSLGGRYVNAQKSFKGEATYSTPTTEKLDAKNNAQGFGGIIGLDIKPMENLLIAVRYETATKLEFETTVNDGNDFFGMFTDGEKTRHDLPALLAVGISIMPVEKLTLTTSLDIFFIGMSDQDKGDTGDGYDDDYDDYGYEASVSAEYQAVEGLLAVSAGYMYGKVGGNKDTYSDTDFSLDSHSVGLGAKVTPVENLALTIAVAKITYISSEGFNYSNVYRADYEKSAWTVALGAEYKL